MPMSAAPDAPEPSVALPLVFDAVTVDRARPGDPPFRALDAVSLTLAPGAIHGLAGPSGAGKSTLLHLASGLTRPSAGRVLWGTTDLATRSETDRTRWRRETIGFVFQDFHLVDELSVLDNILLPTHFAATRADAATRDRALALVARCGLVDPARRAARLSRGERQRVAVARALLGRPALILADEPTASLDADNGRAVADLLVEAAREAGATLLVVTHDSALLARLDRVHRLVAGRLEGGPSNESRLEVRS